jgi:hypothetical protein
MLCPLIKCYEIHYPDLSLLTNRTYWNNWKPKESTSEWRAYNKSIYKNNEIYKIKGINLNGLESDCVVPLGLWEYSLEDYFDILHQYGFNSVRLPLSYEIMANLSTEIKKECITKDNYLHEGNQARDVIKYIIRLCEERNMTLLVDLHTIGGIITEFPFTATIVEYMVVESWIKFMEEFHTYSTLFSIELKNEPHGFILLEEYIAHCGLVVYNVMKYFPKYQGLFVISGVQMDSSGWGSSFANLIHPNILCLVEYTDRYILSPHIYGNDVRGDALDEKEDDWYRYYGFLQTLKNHWKEACVLPTEIGGYMCEGSKDRDFFEKWSIFHKEKLGYKSGAYLWNLVGSYSADTGGLIEKDGKINLYKDALMNYLIE